MHLTRLRLKEYYTARSEKATIVTGYLDLNRVFSLIAVKLNKNILGRKANFTAVVMSAQQQQQKRPIRVLVSKLGLDGHDRGALVICRAFRDAGMEVIYSGLFCTPDQVANMAIDEDVDVVAMSLLNGAHLTLFPKVARILKEKGAGDILVVGGGIIPESDRKELEKHGVTGNFGPGTPLPIIINHIMENIKKREQ
jgi:methylmalonyl-CoA mutase C-terminal domain/subunit